MPFSEAVLLSPPLNASERIRQIPSLFQECRLLADKTDDLIQLQKDLLQITPIYRPVAYEAVAMGLAIRDSLSDTLLETWRTFLNLNPSFRSHIHVGLGWAVARIKSLNDKWQACMEPNMIWRVYDGMGYHDGFFKKNSFNSESYAEAYYQGKGRSFWHEAGGRIDLLENLINREKQEMKSALWTGIGVAAAFIGGISANQFNDLLDLSAEFQSAVICGLLLAIKVRYENQCDLPETDEILHTVLNGTHAQWVQWLMDFEPDETASTQFLSIWKRNIMAQIEVHRASSGIA